MLTGALTRVPGEDVGGYTINKGDLRLISGNYTLADDAFTPAALAINPRPFKVTITGDRTEVPYDGQRHTAEGYQIKADSPLYSANDFVFYPTETDPAAVTTVKRTDEGETLMNLDPRQFSNLNGNFYVNFVIEDGYVKISPKPITVTAVNDKATKTYGDPDPELTYTIDPYGLDDKVTGTLSRVKGENAGTYAITQGNLTTTESGYVLNFVPAVFTIDPKPLTVAAKNAEKTYGDADPDLTYTVKPEALADAVTGKLNRAAGQGVGTYAIRGDNLTVDANYSLNVVPGTLTIDRRPLTVKVNQKSKTYGVDDPGFTCTAEGLVAGDSPSLTVTRAEGENVGSYDFTCDNAASCPNYDITVEGKFTVTPKQVGLSRSTDPLTYNGYNQKPAATATGLEDGDSCTVTVEGDGVDAGTYTATAVSLSNPNYKLPYAAYCTQPYTIGKADKADEAAPNAVTVAFKGVESGKLDLSSALKGATDWTVTVGKDLSITSIENQELLNPNRAATSAVAYRHAGWFRDPECTQPYNPEELVTDELTLFAGWKTLPIVNINVKDVIVTQDGKAHSMSEGVTIPDNAGIDLYYSTTTALTEANYKTAGKKEAPARTDVGQNTVYLYAVSPDGSCAPRLSKTTAKLQITKRANPVAVSAPEASSAPAAPAAEPILTIPGVKKSNKARVEVGKVYQIDLGGNVAKNYKSSRKKIATVDRNGLVVPKAKGKVKITFKVGKKKRTINLTVTDPTVPTVVTITASGPLTGKKGETVQLTATLPSGTKSAIKWQSSNKKVATVSSTGPVTFKKPGKATITATAVRGKKKAKVKVSVSK